MTSGGGRGTARQQHGSRTGSKQAAAACKQLLSRGGGRWRHAQLDGWQRQQSDVVAFLCLLVE